MNALQSVFPASATLISAGAKDPLGELVRILLPELAQKIIQEEIRRIREEEMPIPQGEELAALIKDAFTPRVEYIAKEMVREMVAVALPGIAQRLVLEELARIDQPNS